MRKTKIICTIGPASENKETLTRMVKAGMNVARLNFSHGTYPEHQKKIDLIKEVRSELGVPLGIMLDTKGPEYRIRTFRDGKVTVCEGDTFTFTTDEVEVGVVKAYSSCVGEGPFTCEMFGQEADALREAGFEYGAKTGRPRRVGPIDIVATRYGVRCQGATNIALTKMDVMGYMDRIPVCVQYEVNGEKTDEFPFPCLLADAKPVIEYLDGWKCDISGIRTWDALPEAAKRYVEYVEEKIGCHIGYVSVGPERDSIILR